MMAAVVVAAMATRLIHMVLPFDGVNDGRWVALLPHPAVGARLLARRGSSGAVLAGGAAASFAGMER